MIRLDIEVPTEELIEQLLVDHDTSKFEKMQRYYEGEHEILNRTMNDEDKPNNQLVHPFPTNIVNMFLGYFLGEPVTYSSEDENYMEALKEIFDANDEQSNNSIIGKEIGIKGKAYEILFSDEEANAMFACEKPENMIMVYDTKIKPEPLFAIRRYVISDPLEGEDVEKAEVYTEDKIMYYAVDGDTVTLEEEEDHFFGEVPVIEYLNNDEGMGDFERVITLIDAYNKAQSDTANDFEYFADAYLALIGYSGTDDEDIKNMKENRVLLLEEEGGAQWVTKTQDYLASREFKERLEQDTHKFAQVPNLTDEQFAQNLSGVSIRYKLWGMEQAVSTKERHFKKALQRRLKLLTNFLNVRGSNYDYKNVNISFTRNIPENEKDAAELVGKLAGYISQKTLLSYLPFVEDPQKEMERVEEERQERVDLNDFADEEDEE